MKSDGQIAYEAFADNCKWKTTIGASQMSTWDDLHDYIQRAWEAAAKAVLEANAVVKPGL